MDDFGINSLAKYCNEALLLAILRNGKKHGYQLALEIEDRSNGLFRFNHGTMYPILHKLEKGKLIKGSWKSEGPKRKRKYYSITVKGKKYLAVLEKQWDTFFSHFQTIMGEDDETGVRSDSQADSR